MKKSVLSNLIKFVTSNVVTKTPIQVINETIADFEENGDEEFSKTNSLDKSMIWLNIREKIKLDKLSIYLLENFKHAIESENYGAASYMKKEIDNHWDIYDDDFWRIGRDYLVELKNGFLNSKHFEYLIPEIGDILYMWVNKGMCEYDYIVEKLETLDEIMNNDFVNNKNIIRKESLDFIINGATNDHPITYIDIVKEYFNLLNPTE
jgi:hypothetical protein